MAIVQELWDLYWCPMRLSFRQKVKLAVLLGYLAQTNYKPGVLFPHVETLRPYPEDIGIFEDSEYEDDDMYISEEITAKIAELVAECKELKA